MSAMNYMLSSGVPADVAASYATGFMNNSASAFSAMPSGAQAVTHDLLNYTEQTAQVSRADGYIENPDGKGGSFFSPRWINNRTERIKMLHADPEYAFLSKVAGLCGREPEMFYDREAFDEHAKRMLQRAAVAEELSKTALSDIDHANSVVKDIARRSNETSTAYTNVVRALAQLKNAKAGWDDAKKAYRAVTAPGMDYSSTAVDSSIRFNMYLTMHARAHSPSEGTDNIDFADRFLAYMTHMAQQHSLVNVDSARNDEPYTIQANAKIPREMHLSAFWTFAAYATRSQSALEYAAHRMHLKGAFPEHSVYAKDEASLRLFCDDIKTLVNLVSLRGSGNTLNDVHTKNAVTMKTMSPLLFIHLRCMHERWYTSEAGPKRVCDNAPVLLKPVPISKLTRESNRIRLIGQTEDEERESAMLFVEAADEGSTLGAQQRKLMNTTNPDQFQNMLSAILGAVYRYGVATLFYDTNRIKGLLCKETEAAKSAVMCAELEGKFKFMRSFSPELSLDNVVATVDYFFGGLNAVSSGVMPDDSWIPMNLDDFANVHGKTAAYTFVDNALKLFETVAQNQDWEWHTDENGQTKKLSTLAKNKKMYVKRLEELQRFMQFERSTFDRQVLWRKYATLQATGVVEAFADIIRAYEKIRIASSSQSYTGESIDVPPIAELSTYMGEEDTKSVAENKESSAASKSLFRLLESLDFSSNNNQIERDLNRVIEKFEVYENEVKERTTKQNKDLLAAEKDILDRVNKRASDLGNFDSTKQIVRNLKGALAETYVTPADWAMRPENSGVLIVNNKYRAGVDVAYDHVQLYCENLRGVPLDVLKRDAGSADQPGAQTFFAQYVASKILEVELSTNDRITLNNAGAHNRLRARDIMTNLRKVPRPSGYGYASPDLRYKAAFSGTPLNYGPSPLPYGGLVAGHNWGSERPLLQSTSTRMQPRNDAVGFIASSGVKRQREPEISFMAIADAAPDLKNPFIESADPMKSELRRLFSRVRHIASHEQDGTFASMADVQKFVRSEIDAFSENPRTRKAETSAAKLLSTEASMNSFADEVGRRAHSNATSVRWRELMATMNVLCELIEAEDRKKAQKK